MAQVNSSLGTALYNKANPQPLGPLYSPPKASSPLIASPKSRALGGKQPITTNPSVAVQSRIPVVPQGQMSPVNNNPYKPATSLATTQQTPTTTQNTDIQTKGTQETTQPVSTYQPLRQALYPTVVTQLANQGQSPYNQSATQSINNLGNTAFGNFDYAKRSREIADEAGKTISQLGQQGANAQGGYLSTGTSPVGEGNAAIVAQTTAAKQQAAAQGANMQLAGNAQGLQAQGQAQQGFGQAGTLALTGQGQAQSALGTAAGYAQPQQYGLYNQPYNPVEDTYGGGGSGGAINRAVQASNIGSAQDFQTKSQTIQATTNSANANFDVLNSYAQGFAGNLPIINAIKEKISQNLLGNDAIAGFQAQLENIVAAYRDITGADLRQAIPDLNKITPSQLKQVQDTLTTTAQNKLTGYQQQLNSLKEPQGGTQSSSSSIWDW